ncbi:MAG: hypothetical protein U0836_17515 [Pirellulales bacterium]
MTQTLEQLALVTGGRLVLGAGCPASREVAGRVALPGEQSNEAAVYWSLNKSDAKQTEQQAWATGKGLVTETPPRNVPAGCWALVVGDARRALHAWARHQRDLHGRKVLAVVGEHDAGLAQSLLAAALGLECAASGGDADARLCADLTSLTPVQHTAIAAIPAIDAERLAILARPTIALCLTGGAVGGSTGGAWTEAATRWRTLLSSLPSQTLPILPGDDLACRRAASERSERVLFVGRGGDCDLVANRVACRDGKLTFQVENQTFGLATWGRHRLAPALAAIAVARELGQSLSETADALAAWVDPAGPAVLEPTGVLTIGPVRTPEYRAALAMLREVSAVGRRVVVCGQDEEHAAPRMRRRMGQLAVLDCGADLVVAYGEHSDEVARGARKAGLPADRAVVCQDVEEARRFALRALRPGDTVLLHGPENAWRDEQPARQVSASRAA